MKAKPFVIGSSICAMVAAQLGIETFAGGRDRTLTGEQIVYYATVAKNSNGAKWFKNEERGRAGNYYNADARRGYMFWSTGLPEVYGATPLAAEFLSAHTSLLTPQARGVIMCDQFAGKLRVKFSGSQPPETQYVGDGVRLLTDLRRNAAVHRRYQVQSISNHKIQLYGSREELRYSAIAIALPLDETVRLVYGDNHSWPRFADGAQVANIGGYQTEAWLTPGTVRVLTPEDKAVQQVDVYSALERGRWVPTWDRVKRYAMAAFNRVPFGEARIKNFAHVASERLSDWALIDAAEVWHEHFHPCFYPREEEAARLEVIHDLIGMGIYPIGGVAKGLEPSLAEDVIDALTVGAAIGI